MVAAKYYANIKITRLRNIHDRGKIFEERIFVVLLLV